MAQKRLITQLIYIRVPLGRLVMDYHEKNMKGKCVEWSYDARKDEVLIETMIEEE